MDNWNDIFRVSSEDNSLFFCKILYTASTFTASTFLFFTTIFNNEKIRINKIILIFLPNLILCYIILFSNTIANLYQKSNIFNQTRN